MAGSGKTTLMQRMAAHLHASGQPAYILNLDPAVINVPYAANIDIRDTVSWLTAMLPTCMYACQTDLALGHTAENQYRHAEHALRRSTIRMS